MTYLGLSLRETAEAISDLIARDELQLSSQGRLILTSKSQDYFNEVGESPHLTAVFDSGATLTFELAGFTCLGSAPSNDKWKNGISLEVDKTKVSNSEAFVERQFQHDFHAILEKGYLSKTVSEGADKKSVYTVNSVHKLWQTPLRLHTEFFIEKDGGPVEREYFEKLADSEAVHGLISNSLSGMVMRDNAAAVSEAMAALSDESSLQFLNGNSIDLALFLHVRALQDVGEEATRSVVGPIYSGRNWDLILGVLAPVIDSRLKDEGGDKVDDLIWIAPSDRYWGVSSRCAASLSAIVSRSKTKKKQLFNPKIFLPVRDENDRLAKGQWIRDFDVASESLYALREGFLQGCVEVLYFPDEFVAVLYHISKPEKLPVSLPLGFLTTDKEMVRRIGHLALDYINGNFSFDKPNNLGRIVR